MQHAVAAFLIALSFITHAPANTPRLKADDFAPLAGAQWKGTLTYLDYRSNKKTSIPSNLTVTQSAADKRSWTFDYQYPKEPQADGKKTVTIGEDGTTVNDEKVVERTRLAGRALRIVTAKQGAG